MSKRRKKNDFIDASSVLGPRVRRRASNAEVVQAIERMEQLRQEMLDLRSIQYQTLQECRNVLTRFPHMAMALGDLHKVLSLYEPELRPFMKKSQA